MESVRHTRIVVSHYGGPDELRVVEEECPEPKRGEVRVRVLAAGVSLPREMTFKSSADFQSAQDRSFRASAKNQCATIACRQAHQFAFRFGQTKLLGSAHDLSQLLNPLALFVDEQL